MSIKEYLRQYYWARKNLARERERLEAYRALAEGVCGNRLCKTPGSALQGDKLSMFASKAADLSIIIDGQIKQLVSLLANITIAIDGVADPRQNRLLKLRYIDCLPWEAIAEDLGYTREHVWRLHGSALKAVEAPE